MNRFKLLLFLYPLVIVALFIYSFTQVDLSLTLSKASIYQTVERYLQQIGFFQRPLSTAIYLTILTTLTLFYISFLYSALKKKINFAQVSKLIIFSAFLLAFSYNAFSYDLFNYIFDAKIVTYYHQIPYLHSALDYANDPMLSFMRWTHRVYPYGPTWLLLTVPLSFLGMNYFLPTFFLFKFLAAFSFLGSCFLIYKISEKIFPENKLFNLVFFAFNPLIIVDSLVSAHNDISMIFLFLLAIYLYLNKKLFSSLLFYALSIGIKFSTGILLPLVLLLPFMEKAKKKINWEVFLTASVFLSLATVVLATVRTTFQPWYLLFPLSLVALVCRRYYFLIPSIIITIFATIVYAVYVYMTDYAKDYPIFVFRVEIIGLLVALFFVVFYVLKLRISPKH